MDARHLKLSNDQLSEFWPLDILATQLARAKKRYKSAIDYMYTYANANLHDETIKLTGCSTGDQLLAVIRRLYGHKSLRNFSHSKCLCFSKTWFVKDLHWFTLINFYLCQTLNHICCNLSRKLHDIAE